MRIANCARCLAASAYALPQWLVIHPRSATSLRYKGVARVCHAIVESTTWTRLWLGGCGEAFRGFEESTNEATPALGGTRLGVMAAAMPLQGNLTS